MTSLRGCSSLSVLDLSRNAISRQEAVLSLLQAQNIQLLCLLGNPLSDRLGHYLLLCTSDMRTLHSQLLTLVLVRVEVVY